VITRRLRSNDLYDAAAKIFLYHNSPTTKSKNRERRDHNTAKASRIHSNRSTRKLRIPLRTRVSPHCASVSCGGTRSSRQIAVHSAWRDEFVREDVPTVRRGNNYSKCILLSSLPCDSAFQKPVFNPFLAALSRRAQSDRSAIAYRFRSMSHQLQSDKEAISQRLCSDVAAM
jgi:hypothetical protein